MIKRSAVIVLTLLYLVTTVGFALNLHYCFNRVTSVNFDTPAKSCGMAIRELKCCKKKHLVVKVSDAHQGKSLTAALSLPMVKLAPFGLPNFFLCARQSLAEANFRVNSPDPPPGNVISYLKNCVFRI